MLWRHKARTSSSAPSESSHGAHHARAQLPRTRCAARTSTPARAQQFLGRPKRNRRVNPSNPRGPCGLGKLPHGRARAGEDRAGACARAQSPPSGRAAGPRAPGVGVPHVARSWAVEPRQRRVRGSAAHRARVTCWSACAHARTCSAVAACTTAVGDALVAVAAATTPQKPNTHARPTDTSCMWGF